MPHSSAALAAGLRLAAHRLGASAAHAYTVGADGAFALAASSRADAAEPGFAAVAETLGSEPAVLDVSGVSDVRFAVGQRSSSLAFIAVGVDSDGLDAGWDDAFAEALVVVEAVLQTPDASFPGTASHARLLHEVATHPGAFDERLRIGLVGLRAALGAEATAFCAVTDGVWRTEAVCDPEALLPGWPVAIAETPCRITIRADGPVALDEDGAYLGAPVFADGRTVGTLIASSRAPRAEPFSADDRALIESLARWVGSAVGGRAAIRRLADREAALSAFVDRAPVSMGLVVYDETVPDDLRFVTVNATAAALLGASAGDLAGHLASDVGVSDETRRAWAFGCRRALSGSSETTLEPIRLEFDTAASVRVLSVTLGRLDVHDADGTPVACVTFVAEDVTERELGLRAATERRDALEHATTEQAALFETLHRDLRSPLTTILGYADLLADDVPADDVQAVREVLIRSGHHLLALLDDAVAVAEAARISVSLVPVDAGRLIGAAVGTCRVAAEASGVQITCQSDASPAPVLLDPSLVERVVQALLGAATECAIASDEHRIDVRLGDDGRDLVLDARVPGAVSCASPPEGALAERLAERMGGSFSATDAGCWQVRLPRHPAVVVELPAPRAAEPAAHAPATA